MPLWEIVLNSAALAAAVMVGYWWGRQSGWNAAWREALKRQR
jgi:hypothetical protein